MESFSDKQVEQIEEKGLSTQQVISQLKQFGEGFDKIIITNSARIEGGISRLTEGNIKEATELYEDNQNIKTVKFVPASGAASRMFKQLIQFKDGNQPISENQFVSVFFENLSSFAFYENLSRVFKEKTNNKIEDALESKKYKKVLDILLTASGLNYGNLPKGLLQFHQYQDETRTPSQEHIIEGLLYVEKNNVLNLHFTVSPQHRDLFEKHLENVDSKVKVTYSIQKPETDTIAVDLENKPFQKSNGELLFRPAGHGALLHNLNEIDADIIFIKNIDNVTTDNKRTDTITYKKALAGVLLDYQSQIFELNKRVEQGENVIQEAQTLLEKLGTKGNLSDEEVLKKLNRPIRVCGVVKNEGEPGGGPFWVKNGEVESLQIVESSQIDKNDATQVKIFNQSTHFNPVDIICGVKDHKGEKYDLMQFRDENTGFISEKSFEGKPLKAMELPGLWNGSMADWHTIFVEVPLSTFCPVKTVNDLLKDGHKN